MRTIYVILAVILLSAVNCPAQTWEAEVFGGASGYIGDINPVRVYKVTDPAYGIAVKRNFDGFWSASINAIRGRIQGNDADSPSAYQRARNLSFFSSITEISAMAEFNFFNYLPGAEHAINHHLVTPFLFAGIGGVFFSPKTMYKGAEYELQPYQTEGALYTLSSLSIPYGAGVKYNIKNNWSVVFKIGYRLAFTDYLDDVSGKYSASVINGTAALFRDRSGEVNGGHNIGFIGTQRGDLRGSDAYMFAGFGISYTFVSHRCFSFIE
jgi:hypothetical protein